MWIALPIIALLALLAYWELKICEGAHLGRRAVVWLYDLSAPRYESIKQFDFDWERQFLGRPLAAAAASLPGARILDAGAGTGRAARALLPLARPDTSITSLEPSRRMILAAQQFGEARRAHWAQGWCDALPFAAETFDLVACLEVLEFTPNPRRTAAEMARVLRPGGWLLITNRVGWQAPLIVGRTFSRQQFPAFLRQAGLQNVQMHPWQVDYDLVWAQKPFEPA
jgi:ubiquinone/menaquinone biosynthesis C-methylase UbiE